MSNVNIIHIIYHATRFCAAAVIKSKRKDIAGAFVKHWIAIFGLPCTIPSDNGGECNNNTFRELGEQINITIRTTAAESSLVQWDRHTIKCSIRKND